VKTVKQTKNTILKLLAGANLATALFLATSANVNATVIDNGSMLPSSGGSCSTCSDLDNINYMNFDTLTLSSNSTLNSIDFEINRYSQNSIDANTDFRIDIWSGDHTTQIHQWDFNGSQLDSFSNIGSNTWTISYDLGDIDFLAGDYDIGIASDFGAHELTTSGFTAGSSSDGSYEQYYGNNTFHTNRGGDLPFRLTINETTVPEPGTLALLSLGLLGLSFGKRKIK